MPKDCPKGSATASPLSPCAPETPSTLSLPTNASAVALLDQTPKYMAQKSEEGLIHRVAPVSPVGGALGGKRGRPVKAASLLPYCVRSAPPLPVHREPDRPQLRAEAIPLGIVAGSTLRTAMGLWALSPAESEPRRSECNPHCLSLFPAIQICLTNVGQFCKRTQ